MAIVGPSTYASWVSVTAARPRKLLGVALAAVFIAQWTSGAVAQSEFGPQDHRFLVIYENDSTIAAYVEAGAGIERVLAEQMPSGRAMYTEYRDLVRFPGLDHEQRFAEQLAAKYSTLKLDAVLAGGVGALDFVLRHRDEFAPETPVIFGGVSAAQLAQFDLPADVWGVVSTFEVAGTLALARDLQPDARRIVVVSGSADRDKDWQAMVRAELGDSLDGLEVEYFSGLTLAGFQEMVGGLGLDTILLIVTMFEDSEGRMPHPRDTVTAIAGVAGTPTYPVFSTNIGHGALGGRVETMTGMGEGAAKLALRIIAGDPDVPQLTKTEGQTIIDWRQMRRFGLDGSRLPPDTERLFYEPTAWEQYHLQILLASAVILLQTATIGGLVVQDRRRRRVEAERAVERQELTHLSRTSQLGELSGAFAHELNQPLTAILANAEAGARLLDQDPPDLEEVAAILEDIASDDRRAAGIITELRRLMLKGEAALAPVDLNRLIDATVALIRSEFVARQTEVEVRYDRPDLFVTGNSPQLQQVILNLMLNGTEAMAELPPAKRVLKVETRARDDGWRELAVSDNGPGLTPEMREEVFKPFVSSKSQGLGFGLSICRSIVQAHGGSLAFDPASTRGARIVLALPQP